MIRYATISKVACFRPITDTDQTILQQQYPNLYFPYTQCLDFRQQQPPQQDVLNNDDDENIFVFGGDAWDQGGNDLYVIRQLLFFKYRYPNSVYLIIGNRDGNKMRILQELGLSSTSTSSSSSSPTYQDDNNNNNNNNNNKDDGLPFHKGAYWLRGTGYLGDPLQGPFPYNQTAVERLQWMLTYTMGSPRAFLYRKSELQYEQRHYNKHKQQPTIVTDNDVVESYRQSCHPITGEMGQYLSNSQFIVRFGPILFMHGGLPISPAIIKQQQQQQQQQQSNDNSNNFWDDLSFATPWIGTTNDSTSSNKRKRLSFDEWIDQLNLFATACVANWKHEYSNVLTTAATVTSSSSSQQQQQQQAPPSPKQRDMWSWTGGYHHDQSNVPKFTQLIQYGMGMLPNRTPNPTVVYNSCWKHYLPKEEDVSSSSSSSVLSQYDDDIAVQQVVQNFVNETGIRLICCGHQPQGDMPNAIRVSVQPDTDQRQHDGSNIHNDIREVAWIVSADTSYSGDTKWFDTNVTNTNNSSESILKQQQQRTNVGRGNIKSGRGPVAASEVYIEQCIDTGRILDLYFHGTLSDGSTYKTKSLQFWEQGKDYADDDNQTESILSTKTTTTETTTVAKAKSGQIVGTVAHGPTIPDPSHSPHGGQWWNRASFDYLNHPTEMISSNMIAEYDTTNNVINKNNIRNGDESLTNGNDENQSSLTMIVARKGFQVWNHIIQQ